MEEGFCPLASGSKGNCIYFRVGQTKILIDAGLSGRVIEQRLSALGVALEEIQAILISHEHTDHIQGLKTLALKHKIPVLANMETAKGIYAALQECPKFKIFTTGEPFTFGELQIHPFSVQHDTPDPVAFTLQANGLKVGICTDLGFATSLVRLHLAECDHLYVEANHEPALVHASSRPMIYKQRVLGRNGHLCNEEAASLLADVMHEGVKTITLAHLSQECNRPELALEKVRQKIGSSFKIQIAPQEQAAERIYF